MQAVAHGCAALTAAAPPSPHSLENNPALNCGVIGNNADLGAMLNAIGAISANNAGSCGSYGQSGETGEISDNCENCENGGVIGNNADSGAMLNAIGAINAINAINAISANNANNAGSCGSYGQSGETGAISENCGVIGNNADLGAMLNAIGAIGAISANNANNAGSCGSYGQNGETGEISDNCENGGAFPEKCDSNAAASRKASGKNNVTEKMLNEKYGKSNVSEYIQRFEKWKARKGVNARLDKWAIIQKWLEEDGVTKPPPSSFDLDDVMESIKQRYNNS